MTATEFFKLPKSIPKNPHIHGNLYGLAMKVLHGDKSMTPKELPFYFAHLKSSIRGDGMDKEEEQEALSQSIRHFAKAIVSNLTKEKKEGVEEEPFENYVEGLKERVQKNGKAPFEDRLVKGYKVLLNEINEMHKKGGL